MTVQSSPDSNPYATPLAEAAATNASDGIVDFGIMIHRWERLRILYNSILVGVTLFSTLLFCPQHIGNLRFWVSVCFGAIIANTCFFIAPALEGYGTRFRKWNPVLTFLVFLSGTGVAVLLALVSILTFR